MSARRASPGGLPLAAAREARALSQGRAGRRRCCLLTGSLPGPIVGSAQPGGRLPACCCGGLGMLGERLTNLPAHPVSLIGRDEELLHARQRLLDADRGLLTFTGAGGCGKTSLALQIARDALAEFPDGVWLVEF